MSDNQPDLALKEIDEEMRRERLNQFWGRYGKYVIGTALGIILVVGAREAWTSYRVSVEIENANRFESASEAAFEAGSDAISVWNEAAEDLSEGYAVLARFRLAAASLTARNFDEAIGAYDAIATDKSVSESYRDLARLLAAMTVVDAREDYADARSRLSVVAVKGRTWFYSATEQLALLDLLQGDKAAARSRFATLTNDPETPTSMRSRAGAYEAMLRDPIPAQPTGAPADAKTPADAGDAPDGEPAATQPEDGR